MSLRMNLYGWDLPAFKTFIGSKNSPILEKANVIVAETLPEESSQTKAKAWLHTLVMDGFPFREDRVLLSKRDEGNLLTVQMETEDHALALYCLARAVAGDHLTNYSSESSNWKHQSINALHSELVSCGFTKSRDCGTRYFSWISGLNNGTPLFGDDFRTQWSFYTIFSHNDLDEMTRVFQAAIDFKRILPDGIPEEIARNMATSLSHSGRQFVSDLTRWFSQIHQTGQDGLIFWS